MRPWAETWPLEGVESWGERRIPFGDFPPSGHACAYCPGVSKAACCQHGRGGMVLATVREVRVEVPARCGCLWCRLRRRIRPEE